MAAVPSLFLYTKESPFLSQMQGASLSLTNHHLNILQPVANICSQDIQKRIHFHLFFGQQEETAQMF